MSEVGRGQETQLSEAAAGGGAFETGGDLMHGLSELMARAAEAILCFDPRLVQRRDKSDASPVTAADEAADAIIAEGLARLVPRLPVVSEEASKPRELGPTFVLVDPLDGTREFLAGRDEYTVNIALIANGRPVAGLVAAPALGLLWRGVIGQGAERLTLTQASRRGHGEIIRTRSLPAAPVALISRSHLDARSEEFLTRLAVRERLACGSSLKFCRIAEASADLYPRLAPTSEWDIAAGDAVLTAAGGTVLALDGGPPLYGHGERAFQVPGFVAWGDRAAAARHAR